MPAVPLQISRKPPPKVELLRELTPEDIAQAQAGAVPKAESKVRQLRATHHMLARLVADGRNAPDCARLTGYDPSTINSLKCDPAFKELVAHYSKMIEDAYEGAHVQLAGLGMTAVQELQQRLDENPEGMGTRTLLDVAAFALDRSVAPPKGAKLPGNATASGLSININFVDPQGPAIEGTVVKELQHG